MFHIGHCLKFIFTEPIISLLTKMEDKLQTICSMKINIDLCILKKENCVSLIIDIQF